MNSLFVLCRIYWYKLLSEWLWQYFLGSILLWYNCFYSDSCVSLLFYFCAVAGICFSIFAGRECREQQFAILRRRYFTSNFSLPIFCACELFRQQSPYSFFPLITSLLTKIVVQRSLCRYSTDGHVCEEFVCERLNDILTPFWLDFLIPDILDF